MYSKCFQAQNVKNYQQNNKKRLAKEVAERAKLGFECTKITQYNQQIFYHILAANTSYKFQEMAGFHFTSDLFEQAAELKHSLLEKG